MSIIHDALKKAQQQRKAEPGGIPYSDQPKVQRRPRIAIIAIAGVLAAAVIAYLYIPAFHRQKVPPVVRSKAAPSLPPVVSQAKPADRNEARKTEETSLPSKADAGEPKTRPEEARAPKTEQIVTPSSQKETVQTVSRRLQADRKPARKVPAPERTSKVAAAHPSYADDGAEEPIRRTVARRTEEGRLEARYNEALDAIRAGRTREAQRIFLEILSRRPDHVESLNNLGVICASQGDKKAALNYFKRILDHRRDYPKAYNNIGLIMMSDGDAQLAEEYFRKAISIDPNGLEPHMNLSALLRTQGKFKEAEKVLEVPIKKDGRDPLLFLSYAVIKDSLGKTGEAVKYYRQYLSLAKPSDAQRNATLERLRYLEGGGRTPAAKSQ